MFHEVSMIEKVKNSLNTEAEKRWALCGERKIWDGRNIRWRND